MNPMTVPPSRHSIPEQTAPRHDAKVIAKGAGVNLLGTLARTIKSASFILMTRLFGAEVFGLYVLGWSVIDLLSRFSMFGLEKGVMKFAIQHRVDKNEDAVHRTLGEALLVGLIVSAVMTALAFVAAPVIAVHVFHKPELTRGLRILTFSIPFLTLSHVLLAASKSLKIMRFEAYVKSIAEPLVMFAAAGACFVIGWRFSGITLAHLAAAVGGTVFALYFFRRLFSLKACVRGMRSVRLWSEMTRFSLPVVCYDLLYILMMRLDALMLGYYLPAVQVGIYGIAVEIALLTKKIRHWFEPIFAPIISELHHQRQMNRLEENFSLVTRWFLTITIPFFFGIVLIGQDLLAVFGPEFTVGGLSLILLTLSQILYGSMGSGDLLLLMAGHPYLNLMNTALVLGLNFGLGLFLIPRYGMVGAAVGTFASFAVLSLIRLVEVYLLLRIHPFRQQLIKPVVAGLVAFLFTAVVRSMYPVHSLVSVIVYSLLFVIGYVVMLVRLGLEAEDRQLLRAGWARLRSRSWDRVAKRAA